MNTPQPTPPAIRDRIEVATEKFIDRYKIQPLRLTLGHKTAKQLAREISQDSGQSVRIADEDVYGTMKVKIAKKDHGLGVGAFVYVNG